MPLKPTPGIDALGSLATGLAAETVRAEIEAAGYVRVDSGPWDEDEVEKYIVTGTLTDGGTPITTPKTLSKVSNVLWQDGVGSSLENQGAQYALVLENGFWVADTADAPEDATWVANDDETGTPILTLQAARTQTLGQFAYNEVEEVMYQFLGTWVAILKPTDLNTYATQGDLALKANIVSPAITGNPTVPTQAPGNNSTRIANTAFVAAGFQPLDSDLTEIAALTTTSTGRALLTESVSQTGTGALVRAASPTFTGTVNAAAITAIGTISLTGTTSGTGRLSCGVSDVIIGNALGGAATFRLLPFLADCYFDNTTSGAHIFRAITTELFRVSPTTQAGLLTIASAAVKGLCVRGASSQTANLQEWQNSSSTVLASVSSAGIVASRNILTVGASQTSSFTAVAGTLHPINLSGVGADLTITMPATPTTGDVVGVVITATNASYEAIWNRNGNTMRGSTDVSALPIWQVGEILLWQWNGSTWMLIEDGRIPQIATMRQEVSQNISHDSATKLTFGTVIRDTSAICNLANSRITPRRAGLYKITVAPSLAALDDGTRVISYAYTAGNLQALESRFVSYGSSVANYGSLTIPLPVLAGENIEAYVQWDVSGGSGTKATVVVSDVTKSKLYVQELLQ